MAANRLGLRKLWFQVHKWIGILLAILLVPLSLSGSALVWNDWLDEAVNPQRAVSGSGEAALPPSAYVAAARARLDAKDRIAVLRFGDGEAALLSAVRPAKDGKSGGGQPVRTNVWLDPADARVLDAAGANAGLVRVLHNFHGNLLVPGIGRQIVGWLGVAMLCSSLTGLWLWWPTAGRFARGLRWRRGNDGYTNLHHQTGFWVCLPLAMLSLTGAWISFPAFFAMLIGAPAPDMAARMARMRSLPLAETALDVDTAVAAARALRPGKPVSITWPSDRSAEWRVSISGEGRPVAIDVDDATGVAAPAKDDAPGGQSGIARTMRRLHDGDGMGLVWQVVIFVGGIIPAILGVTGIVMWWRSRGWRADVARRMRDREAAVAAE